VTILEKIINDKKKEVQTSLKYITPAILEKGSQDKRIPLDFKKGVSAGNLSLIAEVKKASPSKGLIRSDFNPVEIALAYEKSGAACISVLTEIKYFQGNPAYLQEIKKQVSIPLLRKDFMVDGRQVRESYDLGADAILLIVSALTRAELIEFKKLTENFGLTSLVEVHSREELELALDLGFDLIGINNRNLNTFETDIEHSIQLKKHIPTSILTVSESGIHTADDCLRLQQSGFDAVLVGESLMRKPDPGKAVLELMEKVRCTEPK